MKQTFNFFIKIAAMMVLAACLGAPNAIAQFPVKIKKPKVKLKVPTGSKGKSEKPKKEESVSEPEKTKREETSTQPKTTKSEETAPVAKESGPKPTEPEYGKPGYDSYRDLKNKVQRLESRMKDFVSAEERLTQVTPDMVEDRAEDIADNEKEFYLNFDPIRSGFGEYKSETNGTVDTGPFEERIDQLENSFKTYKEKYNERTKSAGDSQAKLGQIQSYLKTIEADLPYVFPSMSYAKGDMFLNEFGGEFESTVRAFDLEKFRKNVTEWKSITNKSLYTKEKVYNSNLERYESWREDFMKRMVIQAVQYLFTQYDEAKDKDTRLKCAQSALGFANGGLIHDPGNSTLKELKTDANSRLNKELGDLKTVSALHRSKLNTMQFFNGEITPGSEAEANIASTWRAGKPLSGMVYLASDIRSKFSVNGGNSDIETYDSRSVKLVIDGKEDDDYVDLVFLNKDRKGNDNYVHFYLLPPTGKVKPINRRTLDRLAQLSNGTYSVKVILEAVIGRQTYEGSIKLLIDDAAKAYFRKGSEAAVAAEIADTKMPASRMSNASIESRAKQAVSKLGTPLKAAIVYDHWHDVTRSGVLIEKMVKVWVGYKNASGQCYIKEVHATRKVINGKVSSETNVYGAGNPKGDRILCNKL